MPASENTFLKNDMIFNDPSTNNEIDTHEKFEVSSLKIILKSIKLQI